MQVAQRTEVGHVRTRNEDSLLVRTDRGVLAVADGLGGHPAGDVASRTAVEHLDRAGLSGGSSGSDLRAAAAAAHEAVRTAGEEPGQADMGTTLVLAALDRGSARVLHVGDSRAYLLEADGRLVAVTEDHGVNGYLSQALGLDRGIEPDVATVETPPGCRLLLCTDGLTNMVSDDVVAELLGRGDAQAACDALVDAALDSGGVDNITVIVVTF